MCIVVDFTIVEFAASAKAGEDVDMMCAFGIADKDMELTWYRDRPHTPTEKILTFTNNTGNIVTEIYKDRISFPTDQDYRKNHSLTLLNVDSNDISKYWCQIEPDIYNTDWRDKQLQIEGLYENMFALHSTNGGHKRQRDCH